MPISFMRIFCRTLYCLNFDSRVDFGAWAWAAFVWLAQFQSRVPHSFGCGQGRLLRSLQRWEAGSCEELPWLGYSVCDE